MAIRVPDAYIAAVSLTSVSNRLVVNQNQLGQNLMRTKPYKDDTIDSFTVTEKYSRNEPSLIYTTHSISKI